MNVSRFPFRDSCSIKSLLEEYTAELRLLAYFQYHHMSRFVNSILRYI